MLTGGGPTVNPKVFPLADVDLTGKILNVVNVALKHDQLKKGISETVKALDKNLAQFVILAADAQPLDILLHIPLLCEQKAVLYCFVPYKAALGRAGGINRNVVACVITLRENSAIATLISDLIIQVEHACI